MEKKTQVFRDTRGRHGGRRESKDTVVVLLVDVAGGLLADQHAQTQSTCDWLLHLRPTVCIIGSATSVWYMHSSMEFNS